MTTICFNHERPLIKRAAVPISLIKKDGPHKYGCLMAVIPQPISKMISDWAIEEVLDVHLGKGGRELFPHITIKYGFTDPDSLSVIKAILARSGPLNVRLLGADLFRGNEDGDVLHVLVESQQLADLHAALSELPNEDKHPEYKPHLTVAYLRPEVSDSYLKNPLPFCDLDLMIDEVEWNSPEDEKERIPLTFFPMFGGKTMSSLNELSGGALVRPPGQRKPIRLMRSKFSEEYYATKAVGTCERGQRADLTGCIPETGDESDRGSEESDFEKTPAKRGRMVTAKRVGKGKEAQVILADGNIAPDFIKLGMVPPNWTGVEVTTDPEAELLVTAKDAKGRVKVVYRDSFHIRNAAIKFARVSEMIAKKDQIDDEIQSARRGDLREEAECAWLMSLQATRPGSDSDTGADERAYGATTLEGRHVVKADDGIRLQFIGKEGVHHDHLIRDSELADMLWERKRKAGDEGRLFKTNSHRVNKFIGTLDGGHFSAKDFRTRRANLLASNVIQEMEYPSDEKQYKAQVKQVAEIVSRVLGNKPQQCLESYINPAVFSVWRANL